MGTLHNDQAVVVDDFIGGNVGLISTDELIMIVVEVNDTSHRGMVKGRRNLEI